MKIDILQVGNLKTNCYILEKENTCIVIDPGDEFKKIDNKLNGKEISAVLITHNHFDHVGALDDIIKKYNPRLLKFDNLEEREYIINKFRFKVILNPGHSSDSVSFLFEKENIIFCGDFIFKRDVGRCDLPTGNYTQMLESIRKIKNYDNLIIYPGHGESTTLEFEKKYNPYFNIETI